MSTFFKVLNEQLKAKETGANLNESEQLNEAKGGDVFTYKSKAGTKFKVHANGDVESPDGEDFNIFKPKSYKGIYTSKVISEIEDAYNSKFEANESENEEYDEDEEELTESTTLYVCNECHSLCETDGKCPECEDGILEEAMKLVVRDGKVIKKKTKKKKKLTSKQKQALAKARKKAHTSSAQKKRAKSLKVRGKRINEAEEYECPKCGYIGAMEEVEDGVFVCPDCGTELELANESFENEKLQEYLDILEVPQDVLNEGEEACIKYLKDEFAIILD